MAEFKFPQSLEHERSIFAACFVCHEDMVIAADILSPGDFYRTDNQKAWEACLALYKAGDPVDLPGVHEKLNGSVSAGYLASLLNEPPATNIETACRIVKDHAVLRKAIIEAGNIQKLCSSGGDPGEIVAQAQGAFLEIERGLYGKDSFVSLADLAIPMADHYEDLYQRGGDITGIPSGFPDLDHLTAGFQPGDLILLAARPSMGKTAFALNCARHQIQGGARVGFFSLEQPREQIYSRLLSQRSKINLHKFRTGRFESEDWQAITAEHSKFCGFPLWIDDAGGLHYSEVRRRARKLYRKRKIEILYIDYLQLASGDSKHGKNFEVESISRALKALAKELRIPIVALSQLSRGVESRTNKRPVLSDLRDSGALEQDADVVIFLYRDEVYNPSENNPERGFAELEIAKQRNGPTGMVKLIWRRQTTRFESVFQNKGVSKAGGGR